MRSGPYGWRGLGRMRSGPYTGPMARPRRRSLGLLFALLAAGFVGVAAYAAMAGVWVVTVAAGALSAWLAELSVRSLK